MRAGAALLVFAGHVKQSSFVAFADLPAAHQSVGAKIGFALCRVGHEAVLVFFVLSGFLVGGQILRRLDDGSFSPGDYAIERGTRILLPLVPAIALTALLDWVMFSDRFDVLRAAWHLAGLNGVVTSTYARNMPLWSLAYEIWFYVLGGAVGCLLSRRPSLFPALLTLAVALCVFAVLPARYLLFWCLGALMARCLDIGGRGRLACLGAALVAAGVAGYQMSLDAGETQTRALMSRPVAEALIAIGVAFAIPLLCTDGFNARLRWLERPASYLSAMSFTLYLVHFPLNATLEKLIPQATDLSWTSIGIFAARIGGIFIVARIFYRLFEARTGQLRAMLRRRWEAAT